MKKGLSFLVGLIIGVIAMFLFTAFWLPGHIFTVYESEMGFDETVEAVSRSVEEKGWTIPHQYNLQATMQNNNLESGPVIIMSLCNPGYGHKVITDEKSRKASALLPCRVAIYEKDGKTFISMLNNDLLSKFMSKNVNNALVEATRENEEIIENAIQ